MICSPAITTWSPTRWHTRTQPSYQEYLYSKIRLTRFFLQHHDTSDNNDNTPFDFTESNYEKAAELIAKYPSNYKASAVIPILDLAQQQNGGWLSLTAMRRVATLLDMAEIRVFEIATFYSMFNRSKVGKYYIQVCGTTPCRLNGAEKVVEALEGHLGIHMGQSTKCGTFTLGEMECMGACANAPMMVISDYSNGVEGYSYLYYEDLSPADAIRIADIYKSGVLGIISQLPCCLVEQVK